MAVLADRLFSYALPGRAGDLQLALEQAKEAEHLGVAGVLFADPGRLVCHHQQS